MFCFKLQLGNWVCGTVALSWNTGADFLGGSYGTERCCCYRCTAGEAGKELTSEATVTRLTDVV